uniref:Putative conserved phosducin-like protein n=1 Tax=Xenopsylla cheopis TaxID=163159 RepID=A0A6M2DLJ8_XENCH
MLSLEDKILGNKNHNYCSSSEDEGDGDSDTEKASAAQPNDNLESSKGLTLKEPSKWTGQSANTGPKGVIKDWQRFKQLETEQRAQQEQERLDLIKSLSITCNSVADDEKQKELDEELEQLMDDEFILEYQKQRMKEMLSLNSNTITFGEVQSLNSQDDFLNAIDDENKAVTVIIHIFENNVKACKTMNSCLNTLAAEYNNVKFCKIVGSIAGLSRSFNNLGVPAILVYKNGQIMGNFVRISDDLGDDFPPSDVESFLIEHGLIEDKYCIPKIITETKSG